ncbi:hypothetical protein CLOM_g11578, partial [Closterium sp. NIES-68]
LNLKKPPIRQDMPFLSCPLCPVSAVKRLNLPASEAVSNPGPTSPVCQPTTWSTWLQFDACTAGQPLLPCALCSAH